MRQLTRKLVAEKLGEYYSQKFTREIGKPAKVWSYFDDQKRAYCIQGEIPHRDNGPYPELAARGQTWTMIDYVKPMRARLLIVPPANHNY